MKTNELYKVERQSKTTFWSINTYNYAREPSKAAIKKEAPKLAKRKLLIVALDCCNLIKNFTALLCLRDW